MELSGSGGARRLGDVHGHVETVELGLAAGGEYLHPGGQDPVLGHDRVDLGLDPVARAGATCLQNATTRRWAVPSSPPVLSARVGRRFLGQAALRCLKRALRHWC